MDLSNAPRPCSLCGVVSQTHMGAWCPSLEDEISDPLRSTVLLSLQRALIGEITPQMRAIEVEWSPRTIILRVFVDGDASAELQEAFDAAVGTQIVADFPAPNQGDPTFTIEFRRVDHPTPVPTRGTLVFARSGVRNLPDTS
jgi:hypothetical protein